MPRTPRSLALTDAYQARLLAIREQITLAVRRLWRLDPQHLDRSYGDWLTAAVALTEAGQRQSAAASTAYLAAFLSEELERRVDAQVRDLADIVGRSRDGRALAVVLDPPLATVKMRLAQGRPFEEASKLGRTRALRSVAFEVHEAGRHALDQAMSKEKRVVGYRRAPRGGACGACLAAATGAIHRSAVVMPVHRSCACVKEPVVRGVNEKAKRPTGKEMFDQKTPAQQNALFRGRGGEAKAELIRSGKVDFDDLITTQAEALGADTFTETSLANLVKVSGAADRMDLVALFDQDFAGWMTGLSADLREALRMYQNVEYATINGVVRGVYDLADFTDDRRAYISRLIADLNQAITEGQLQRFTLLNRGVDDIVATLGMQPEDAVGQIVALDGFVSTSVHTDEIRGFATGGPTPAILQIEAPPGTPAAWIAGVGRSEYHNEGEVLLRHGVRLRVLSATTDAQGRIVVRARVVG